MIPEPCLVPLREPLTFRSNVNLIVARSSRFHAFGSFKSCLQQWPPIACDSLQDLFLPPAARTICRTTTQQYQETPPAPSAPRCPINTSLTLTRQTSRWQTPHNPRSTGLPWATPLKRTYTTSRNYTIISSGKEIRFRPCKNASRNWTILSI